MVKLYDLLVFMFQVSKRWLAKKTITIKQVPCGRMELWKDKPDKFWPTMIFCPINLATDREIWGQNKKKSLRQRI